MMRKAASPPKTRKASAVQATGACVCGAVRLEIDVPARWAWHDHAETSRRAQGCAYATYVGSYRSRFRILQGAEAITRFEDKVAGTTRSFCGRCGTPLTYERSHSPTMVNLPRALFDERTGREPRYHASLREAPDWAYTGAPLAPLKGYPGIMWERPRRKPRREIDDFL
ncbi:MAG: glutathione-dependent formaldehyde-activating [Caulobacter sp.]|nr:glutathione-dependent formaldehyde-activating [Caulobacter sp.]